MISGNIGNISYLCPYETERSVSRYYKYYATGASVPGIGA